MATLEWTTIVRETRGNQHCKQVLFSNFVKNTFHTVCGNKETFKKITNTLFLDPKKTEDHRFEENYVQINFNYYIYPDLSGQSDDYVISLDIFHPYEAARSFMFYNSTSNKFESIKDFEGLEYGKDGALYEYHTWSFDSRNFILPLFSSGLFVIVIVHRDGPNSSWGCRVFCHNVQTNQRSSYVVDGSKLPKQYMYKIKMNNKTLIIADMEVNLA